MIKFVEVKKIKDFNPMMHHEKIHYELCEIWLNPNAILQIKEDASMKHNLAQGYLPKGLDKRQDFASVQYGTGNNITALTLVGDPTAVAAKISKQHQELLKG